MPGSECLSRGLGAKFSPASLSRDDRSGHPRAREQHAPARPSLVPQDMPWGDLDTYPWVGRHEVLYLLEALAGKVCDGLVALAAVVVAIIEAHQVERTHRA